MNRTNWRRIFRAFAGVALLMLFFESMAAQQYVPEGAGLWKPAVSADLVGPGAPAMFAADSRAPVFEVYFTNLKPAVGHFEPQNRVSDPLFIRIYQRAKWTLAIGPARAGDDSGLAVQLLRHVDEPATFLIMGAGLILLIAGPRHLRRREHRQKSRAAGRAELESSGCVIDVVRKPVGQVVNLQPIVNRPGRAELG